MGDLAYYFVLAGFVCLMINAERLVPIKKYLMTAFLTIGLFFASAALWKTDEALGILLCVLAVVWLFLFIYALCTGKSQRIEILHIPAGSYEIWADDREAVPTVQLRYLLRYQGVVYALSSVPPTENPALTIHIRRRKDGDIPIADISIDKKNDPVSVKRVLYQLYRLAVLAVALFLPFVFRLYREYRIPENLFGFFIIIPLFYVGAVFTRNGKSLLIRLIHWFCITIEVCGWLVPITLR